jgi:cytochrome c1
MFVARINGTGGNDGDGPPELVGSSIRAARCDHNHLAETLLTASTDTTLVLAPDGAGGVEFRAESGGVDLSAIDFLVGTASGDLSNEIAVGTTPGGELGNTWASPTVDATHSGSAHTDFIAKAIVDAKGDLIVATAADTVARRAVGTDGQVLTADSAQATGVTWTTPSVAADLDDLTDVTITAPAADDDLRYNGAQWVNDPRKWEAVTNGENVFVWEGDDLVHEWNEAP